MQWLFEQSSIDWNELSQLYRIAPLGDKKPDDLKLAFGDYILDKPDIIDNNAHQPHRQPAG